MTSVLLKSSSNNKLVSGPSPTPTFTEPIPQGLERANDDGDRVITPQRRGHPLTVRLHQT